MKVIEYKKREIINNYLKGYSQEKTASICGVSIGTVFNVLKKNNIEKRTRKEAAKKAWEDASRKKELSKRMKGNSFSKNKHWKLTRIKKYPTRQNEKSHFWKGGKTKLSFLIRSSVEYAFWRKNVFERDNYTCVICKRKRKMGDKVILEADHIYPLSKLIDDTNIKTIDEAISCKSIWDINNGRTLCRECHMKTETYGKNL